MNLLSRASCPAVSTVLLALHAGASSASGLIPLSYSSTAHLDTQQASFHVKLDRTPDFLTVDDGFRQADSLQFWVDVSRPSPYQQANDALYGLTPPGNQSVISFREIPVTGQLDVIGVRPLSEDVPRDRGGWGSIMGSLSYSLSPDHELSLSLPLSWLRDGDGTFYYTFATLKYGELSAFYSGISGESHDPAMADAFEIPAVPEPSAWFLALAGVGWVSAARRDGKRAAEYFRHLFVNNTNRLDP